MASVAKATSEIRRHARLDVRVIDASLRCSRVSERMGGGLIVIIPPPGPRGRGRSSRVIVRAALSPIWISPTGVVPVSAAQAFTILRAVPVQVPGPGRAHGPAELDARATRCRSRWTELCWVPATSERTSRVPEAVQVDLGHRAVGRRAQPQQVDRGPALGASRSRSCSCTPGEGAARAVLVAKAALGRHLGPGARGPPGCRCRRRS